MNKTSCKGSEKILDSQSCVSIQLERDIIYARQIGRQFAEQLQFGLVEIARIAATISEIANNIFLYAEKGQICFQIMEGTGQKGLRIIASDVGPGIKNIEKAMEDSYSTSEGLGAGLPGIKRMMDEFEITSIVGEGTRIKVIKWVRSCDNEG